MRKALGNVTTAIISGNDWKKLARPTVSRGNTATPKTEAEQKRLGVRYDYDGDIEQDGVVYHKYQLQVNAGEDINPTLKQWRAKNGGTHAVMANVFVKQDATKEEVEEALETAHKDVKGV